MGKDLDRKSLGDRWVSLGWRMRGSSYVSTAAPVVVGGCGRSGTTLMRVILDTHPGICCGPESGILRPGVLKARKLANRFDLDAGEVRRLARGCRSHPEFVDRFFAAYAARTGKPRWADKSPQNVQRLGYLFRHFPEARFVHMLRDGRDAACSLRTHPKYRTIDGQRVPTGIRNPIDACTHRWVKNVRAGIAWRDDPRYREVRYEDLVNDPEATLRPLFDWLGEEWDDGVLAFHSVRSASRDAAKFPCNAEATQPINSQALARWRTDLSPEEAATFRDLAGDLLIEMGYAEDHAWVEEVGADQVAPA
jgi:hypothetical protein